jgi:transcription initiation factor IIE alpha subunit
MKKVIGLLIALVSIVVGNAHSQTMRIEFDTIINGGYFHFHMNNTQVGYSNSKTNRNVYGSIINSLEDERKKKEDERRAIENYIDSMRVVLFTRIMELTELEAAVFWPAYEIYQDKLDKILEKRREANTKLCDPLKKYKNREYLVCVDIEVKSYREEALLREQYAEKFKNILGEKIYLFYRAENLFIRWIYSTF